MPTANISSPAFITVTRVRFANPFLRRIVLCAVVTALNAIAVAKFAGGLYQATPNHPVEQIGVTSLLAALVGSLARTWFITLSTRPR